MLQKLQSAVVEMRLSAEGSHWTSSCMTVINTSSECKGKCMLTQWDDQCLCEYAQVWVFEDDTHMESMEATWLE